MPFSAVSRNVFAIRAHSGKREVPVAQRPEGKSGRGSVQEAAWCLVEGKKNDDVMSLFQASERPDTHVGEMRARQVATWSPARIAW